MEIMAAARAVPALLSRSALSCAPVTCETPSSTSSSSSAGKLSSGFCGVRIAGFRADCCSSLDFQVQTRGTSTRRKGMVTVQVGLATQVDAFSREERENDHQRPTIPRLQDLDPNTMLQRQRIIFLGGQVDDFSADLIISQMLLLDALDPTQDIKLFINSPGGSVTAGMGIYDAMKLCRADVSTTCFGLAASMGAFLLAAGAKGKRYCMPNARVMIHQPLGGAQGSAIEIGLQVREMMYHKKKLGKIMARLTGQTEGQIDIDTDRDNFMNPWEAKEYGLVDHVVDDGKPGLVAPLGEVKEPPRSKVWGLWTVKEGTERKSLPTEQPNFHGGKKFGDRKEDEVEESKEQEKAAV